MTKKTETHSSSRSAAGFTLIEVMVAMTIFIVLIVVGMGAVLDAIKQHRASQNMRTVMDDLNFVMEDMARNMRIGSEFRCPLVNPDPAAYDATGAIVPEDCAYGAITVPHNVIMFRDLKGNDIVYDISNVTKQITKTSIVHSAGNPDVVSTSDISPPEVTMDFSRSGFDVSGSVSGDGVQPTVTIRLAGTITYASVTSDFSIQTTITARQLDS